MNHRHVRPLLRFWWILVIGVGVALLAGVASIGHISVSVPPKVTYRSRPKFTATEQILLTSAQNPATRTLVGSVRKSQGSSSKKPKTGGLGSTEVTSSTSSTSIYQQLVTYAQYYPHLIASDAVLSTRTKMFGGLRGTVTAKAINSVQTASGKYKPGNVPIIQVDAVAGEPARAIKLASTTVTAFAAWLRNQQDKAVVPPPQRILVTALDVPTSATSSGGPKKTIAIVVALAVLAAFIGLAFVLDKAPVRVVEPTPKPVDADSQDVGEGELVHALEIPANGATGKSADTKRRRTAPSHAPGLSEDIVATSTGEH